MDKMPSISHSLKNTAKKCADAWANRVARNPRYARVEWFSFSGRDTTPR